MFGVHGHEEMFDLMNNLEHNNLDGCLKSSSNNTHKTQQKDQQISDVYFGKHKISSMTKDHCKHAISYILKNNKVLTTSQKNCINSLKIRLLENQDDVRVCLVDIKTGEIIMEIE